MIQVAKRNALPAPPFVEHDYDKSSSIRGS